MVQNFVEEWRQCSTVHEKGKSSSNIYVEVHKAFQRILKGTGHYSLENDPVLLNQKDILAQLLFNNPKNTAAVISTSKNTDSRNSKPKNHSADPCL